MTKCGYKFAVLKLTIAPQSWPSKWTGFLLPGLISSIHALTSSARYGNAYSLSGPILDFRIPAIWVLTTKLFHLRTNLPSMATLCWRLCWHLGTVNKNDSSIPLQTRNLCFRKVTEGGKSPSTVVKLDIKFCHVRVCRKKKKISKKMWEKKRPLYSIFQGKGGGRLHVEFTMCIFSCATAF